MPIIPVLRRLRQEDLELKDSLSFTVRLYQTNKQLSKIKQKLNFTLPSISNPMPNSYTV
jgi:hypothetical protein